MSVTMLFVCVYVSKNLENIKISKKLNLIFLKNLKIWKIWNFGFPKNLKFCQTFRFSNFMSTFFKNCIHPTLKPHNFCAIEPILIIFYFLPICLICTFPQSYLFSGKLPGKFRKTWIRFSKFMKGSDLGWFWCFDRNYRSPKSSISRKWKI